MKSGIATIALRKHDIFYALDIAAQAGFQGVEIWGKPPHTPEEFDDDHTYLIRERLNANGLRVSMFGSYVNPASPDFVQKSMEAIKISKILKTRIIRIWAGNREPDEADDDMWDETIKSLREYALVAEDEGIQLAMEMHGGTLSVTPEGAIRLIEESGAPNLKINYQVIDHSNPELERVISMIGDFVVNIHAQNFRPSKLDPHNMERCLIEQGLVDYDKVLSLLAEHGFTGYIEAEFLRGEHEAEEAMLDALRKDAGYLNRLVEKHNR